MDSKTSRSAPPPLQATSQSKPSLSNTKAPTVVDSAMKTATEKRFANTRQQTGGDRINSSTSNSNSKNNFGGTMQTLAWILGISVIISAIVNVMHVQRMPIYGPTTTTAAHLEDFKKGLSIDNKPHYDTLNCKAYGGPSPEIAQEMVYWKDIPSDRHFVSPFKEKVSNSGRKMYMTFEPDGGGWNNIRMAMETVLALAVATGRTLVLPPEQRMYLLAKNRGEMKTDFSFMDFFPMKELATENAALHMITMEEFLQQEAMTGNLRDKYTGEISFPPENRTNWNGEDVKILKEWLRNVTHTPLWDPDSCIAAFPASGEHKDSVKLQSIHNQILKDGFMREQFLDEPLPVDATPMERMKELLAHREEMCLYDEKMQDYSVVHFMCYHKMRVRMLVHFYVFLYFENWKEDLWMKRFIRDHVRYNDDIQCAAARVVHAMREYVRQKDPTRDGLFDTFHIRRGDFQFKNTRIDAVQIYENVKDTLPDGSILFIATDERDKKFFDPLREHYDLKFLDDFMHVLGEVNHNYFGMIDQLVAARGRLFYGCWFST
jgi:GDP-fucose protein O-fucosyltransferase